MKKQLELDFNFIKILWYTWGKRKKLLFGAGEKFLRDIS